MNPSNLTYTLNHYLHIFSEERKSDILKVLDNWITPKWESGQEATQFILNPETNLCYFKGEETIRDYMMKHYQMKVFEKYITPEELEKCQTIAVDMFREANEKRKFDNAKKYTEKEWGGNPIFWDDEYYTSLCDLKDILYCEYGDDIYEHLPDYVYATKKVHTLRNTCLKSLVWESLEHHGEMLEDPDYLYPDEIPNYLQEAWDRFVDDNDTHYYEEDLKKVVILDKI